ncbi:MAG: MTH1187 family thiamine-binding protein [Phycisphaerae bacterium]
MNVIVDVCIVPMGVGVSVSSYIAECERILKQAGLVPHLHAYGTVVEGEWDAVFAAVRRCHERLHDMGVPRISTSARFGTRTDRDQSITEKIQSVEDKLT